MIACDQKCSDAPNNHAAASAGSHAAPSSRAPAYTPPHASAPSAALDTWPRTAASLNGRRMNR